MGLLFIYFFYISCLTFLLLVSSLFIHSFQLCFTFLNMLFLSFLALTSTIVLSHVSMITPNPRTLRDGSFFAIWQRNEPAVPGQNHASAVCNGLDREANVQASNVSAKKKKKNPNVLKMSNVTLFNNFFRY